MYALHDRRRVRVTCYCLNANDRSEWRVKIEAAAERFVDLQAREGEEGCGREREIEREREMEREREREREERKMRTCR